jgi:hypothetical protein
MSKVVIGSTLKSIKKTNYSVKVLAGKLFDVLVKELSNDSDSTCHYWEIKCFYLELEVDENDMVRVALGQKYSLHG